MTNNAGFTAETVSLKLLFPLLEGASLEAHSSTQTRTVRPLVVTWNFAINSTLHSRSFKGYKWGPRRQESRARTFI